MKTIKFIPKNKSLVGMFLATTMLSASACASSGYVTETTQYNQDQYTDYARVLKVTPLYREVRVAVPERQCWEEQVVHHEPGRSYGGYQSYTPHIIGGVAGGVVGNQFGKGSGKTLLTVAGALLGGSLGRDSARHHRSYSEPDRSYTTNQTRCESRNSYRNEEREDGYEVEYRYNGRNYTTRMDHAPGKKIRVNVQVVPNY